LKKDFLTLLPLAQIKSQLSELTSDIEMASDEYRDILSDDRKENVYKRYFRELLKELYIVNPNFLDEISRDVLMITLQDKELLELKGLTIMLEDLMETNDMNSNQFPDKLQQVFSEVMKK